MGDEGAALPVRGGGPRTRGMTNGRSDDRADALKRLIELAQERARRNRRIVADNVADLFLSAEGRLSEHERVLMGDVLGRLIGDLERRLRQAFADWLARLDPPPEPLIAALRAEGEDLARALMARSPVLREPDLIELVKRRSQEHLLATALRRPLPSDAAQAIADKGEDQVVEELLKSADPTLSRRALEYLVAESQRVDRFQQPVLSPFELPAELCRRLAWWVAGALRCVILAQHAVEPALLDDCIEENTRAVIGDGSGPSIDRHAARLVEALADARELDEQFVVQALRGAKISVFVAALARLSRLEPWSIRRLVFDPGFEQLALLCRALAFDRASFAAVYVLARQGEGMANPVTTLRDATRFFDALDPVDARLVVRYWRAEPDYLEAVAALGGPGGGRV